MGRLLLEHPVQSTPQTEVVVSYTANPRKIIVMLEFVMASVPSALGAACVQLAKNSVLDMTCFAVVL